MGIRLRSLFAVLLRRARMEEEMSSELRFHQEAYIDDLVRRGLSRDDAVRRARLQFGSVEEVSEECREARGLRWPDELIRNVRYALRLFRRAPAFTAAALATLALCIGANTAIFSVVDAVLLRPLPYPHPERLALVGTTYSGRGPAGDRVSHNGESWFQIRDQARSFDVAPYMGIASGANFSFRGRAEYTLQQRVGAGFFHVLGVAPLIGREFTPSEDRPGGPAVVVLGYPFWKRGLNGDASVLGRGIMLRGEPHVVVGVMPPGLRSDVQADLWTPLRASTTGEGEGSNYGIVARVRPGVSWERADTELAVIGETVIRRLRENHYLSPDTQARLGLVPLQNSLTAETRRPLLVLWAAVGAVLLIGCVNVAGLLLAQGAARRREIATRIALGGGRAAVVRQLLTESIVLALIGGALGVFVGYVGIAGLRRYSETLGIWQSIELNLRVLASTAAVALVSSILFGLAPALAAVRSGLRPALSDGARVAGPQRVWPRRTLVAVEVAVGYLLLIGAGLMVRTFLNLTYPSPGFDPSGVLTARISLQDARYRGSAKVNRLFDRTVARIRALPGVSAAAVGLHLPYERPVNLGIRRMDGRKVDAEREFQTANYVYITPEYFRALKIPLHRGREFTAADGPKSQPVLIVNEAFARRFYQGGDPLGKHLVLFIGSRAIVGVVGDVPQHGGFGSFEKPETPPIVYSPVAQAPDALFDTVHTWFSPSWIVRTSAPPQSLIAGVSRAVEAVDPLLPFAGFEPMTEVRAASMRGHRFVTVLLGSLAALALLLAFVGIYGLIANSVAVRTRELGIRLALGAGTPRVVRAVALPGIVLAIAGVAAGFGLSLKASRLVQPLLFGVTATDTATFTGVACGMLAVAAAASCIPALRITRINPAETLRHE